jgi:hypothetical protein
MAEIVLSDGLDTREDALKIAKALWAEAVERDWEGEYRDIISNTEGGHLIPVVGYAQAELAVSEPLEAIGLAGDKLKAIAYGAGTVATVTFPHRMDTFSDDGSCACPSGDEPRASILAHAMRVLGQDNWLPLRYAPVKDGDLKFKAECSSKDCVNA